MLLRRITEHVKAKSRFAVGGASAVLLIFAMLALFSAGGGAGAQNSAAVSAPQTWSGAIKALEEENWQAAAAYFEMRVKARPNAFIAYHHLGRAYHGAADYERALQAQFIAAAYSQLKGAAFYYAARSYAKLDQPEMAFRWLDSALKEGYDDFSQIREDVDLEIIRDDPRFDQMLARAVDYRNAGMPADHPLYQSPWDPAAERVQIRTLGDRLKTGTGGVSVGPDGNIYVADFGPSIVRITPEGDLETVASDLKGASGNFIEENGSIIQAQFFDRSVVRIYPDGKKDQIIDEGLSGPVGVAKNKEGEIFIANCDSHYISVLRVDGSHEVFSRSPLFYCPNGIAFDDQGDLYVANYHDGLIIRVTPDGVAHYIAEVPGKSAGYIAYADGVFFITGRIANRIYKLTREGAISIVAGSGVRGAADGGGKTASFSLPNALAPSRNSNCFYTNDNHKDWRMGANTDAIKTTSLIREIRLDPERGCGE